MTTPMPPENASSDGMSGDGVADPDQEIVIPAREVAAAIGVVDALARLLDADPDLAARVVEALPAVDQTLLATLPEVGPIEDVEGLRLHLHRLDARLRARAPVTDAAPLDRPPVTIPSSGPLRTRRASRSAAVVDRELADSFVWWDDIAAADVEAYEQVLAAATSERPLQKHLALQPRLLVQHLRGGHGRWVVPQKRLGSQYVLDFVIGEGSSSGLEWQFVELQSPTARLFVPSTGRQSAQLDEGLRQILEWRRWLDDNRDYARKPHAHNGLGLRDVTSRSPSLLLIGRAADLTDDDRERRRQLDQELNIRIHTYDWIIREARARLDELHRPHPVGRAGRTPAASDTSSRQTKPQDDAGAE